jgi:hypothetical protein
VVEYLDLRAVYLFAQTCKSSLAAVQAVQAVHKGAISARSLRCFFPPESTPFNYACDSLMLEGASMQRDGVYWLVCAASSVGVDNAEDDAVALRACGERQLPSAWDEAICEIRQRQRLSMLWLSLAKGWTCTPMPLMERHPCTLLMSMVIVSSPRCYGRRARSSMQKTLDID